MPVRRRRAREPGDDLLHEESGQSTTEYAIVFLAFLAMVVALGLVWSAGHKGAFVDAAQDTASHRFVLGIPGLLETVQDVFMF